MGSLSVTVMAALKSKDISLPEIIGCLEMTKINAERQAFQHAQIHSAQQAMSKIVPANIMPNLPPLTPPGN